MSRLSTLVLACACLGALLPWGATRAAAGDTIIVVDASNSMWGQVDGVAKIEIARGVFAELLGDWPADRNLGVLAYGHRRKGDCTDIEQIIAPGPLDADSAIARIAALTPKGRTPLTDAVEQAAEALRYRDVPATVVLLTDGVETCDRDPCALAAALERAGVHFTAHVVGFDVAAEDQPAIACIAERTGGRFLPAESADQLDEALRSVTVAVAPEPEPAPQPARITFAAVDADTAAGLDAARWQITRTDDGEQVGAGDGAELALTLPPGNYRARAQVGEASATAEIQVQSGRSARHLLPLALPLPEATLEAPDSVPAGSRIEVTWTGPANRRDYIALAVPGAPEGSYERYTETRHRNPARLQVPDAVGDYELRYVVGQSKRTLATRPVTLTPVQATLEAPDSVPAGSRIEVAWTGPDNRRDYIAIAVPGAPEGSYEGYTETRFRNPARLQVPDAVGDYELRYVVGQSKRTLATRPVTLTPVQATLETPAEAAAGSEIDVHWSGPDNKGDYIAIVAQGAPEGANGNYRRTNTGSPIRLQVPDALGPHEIRYVIRQSKRTLASEPIQLLPVSAELRVDTPVLPGAPFDVHWTGPNNRGDAITIVAPGAPEGTRTQYRKTNTGNPVQIRAPETGGRFEVRYVLGQSKRTLASLPVEVGAAEVTLSAPPTVAPSAVVEVAFTGPGRYQDLIELVPVGADAKTKALRSARASQGSPLQLFAPAAVGDYQLRYRMEDTGDVLATVPLKVE